ncbi:hypothetical protein [Streptomyces sp. WAC07149]|uniref:hypothetical protein n=1 Tax=Streptomyces sp. WAC07149 TaxID=2487425 RepID=UPI000F7A668A|nr:hypothetical protein [Streptomyces sp. WAC07149]
MNHIVVATVVTCSPRIREVNLHRTEAGPPGDFCEARRMACGCRRHQLQGGRSTITASRFSTPRPGVTWDPAIVADEASPEQITAVRSARAARSRRLRKDLAAAQRERYAAVTRQGKPERLDAVSAMEAAAELAVADRADLSRLALPDLIPPAAPPSDWRTPASLAARTRPKPSLAPDDGEAGCGPEAGATGDGDGAAGGGVR